MCYSFIPNGARGQTLSFSWEMSRRGTHNKRGPRKFLIFGERRKCGKPNSHTSFILQATSDEVLLWCPRQCLTCSTHWALRTTWSCLIILADKSTKIKRLRLSRETIIQLDALIAARRIKIHAHVTCACILLCMVCLKSIFWLRRHHPFQCPLVPRVGGEILEFRSLRSRDLATFDCHYLLYLIILRLISATSASQMHLRSLRSLR